LEDRPLELRASVLRVLAIAHLQAAEDLNCLLSHSGSACIVPVAEDARHREPAHARRAGDLYARLVELAPAQARYAWLLNLSRLLTGDWPGGVPEASRLPAGGLAGPADGGRWRNRGPELGLAGEDLAGGAVVEDFDGDGWLDLVATTWDPCGPVQAFRNDGRGGLEETAAAWGLDSQLGGLNALQGDVDGDGRPDLLVLRGAWLFDRGHVPNSLLLNRAGRDGLRFEDVTRDSGLGPPMPTQAGAFADFDLDGHLDLYLGNETLPSAAGLAGGGQQGSQLFRNRGFSGGRWQGFADVTARAGVGNGRFAKGVAWGDYDDDGDPDLYVSNIGPNRLYRNDGNMRFFDV
ncbi:MAG: VCBS repeat-containing protein, partial [Holophagales bacterium]|nr:VCBS repeat-containing protein [Holophagales bacterium]